MAAFIKLTYRLVLLLILSDCVFYEPSTGVQIRILGKVATAAKLGYREAKLTKQLQADGYLPQLKLFMQDEDARKAGPDDGQLESPSGASRPGGSDRRRGDNGNTKSETDKPQEAGNSKVDPTGGKVDELHGLEHRTGDYNTPDAMVLLPKDFDPSKPINLVVYDHGWYDNAKSAYENAHLAEQMTKAPPNTVLIVPEWQKYPGSSGTAGGDQGASAGQDFMSGMVQDIFDKTTELKGKTLADVEHIGIISHSAGYHAADSELYNNAEFSKKIDSVTLLDSLYDGGGFDQWLQDNIKDLSAGTKHFNNIFNTTTAKNSKAQEERVEKMLKDAGLPTDSLSKDYEHDGELAKPGQLRRHTIVFRSTSTPHMEIPQKYPAIVEAAANGDENI